MRIYSITGSIHLFILFIIFSIKTEGQSVPNPKIESPNAASLDKFGEIPVDLFTGVPDIEIPIHTLSYGKIDVPIGLRYHPGSVRVVQHPGWVGLGWNLDGPGAITRNVRGEVDEFYISQGMGSHVAYFPFPNNYYGTCGSERVDVDDWNTTARLSDYFTVSNNDLSVPDVEADEFTFNFLGYSGKFYYEGPVKGWQVVSDKNIKVELNTPNFLEAADVKDAILQYAPGVTMRSWASNQPRVFDGFTITVPDGTKYVFGGSDAIEFTSLYSIKADGASSDQMWGSAWLLKQIIDVDNNVVNFEYKRSYPTCDLIFGRTNYSFEGRSSGGPCNNTLDYSGGPISTKTHGGFLQWPMYLDKIYCANEAIEFNSSPSSCLRYSDAQLHWVIENVPGGQEFDLYLLNNNLNNLQWEQLNSIVIKNANQGIYRQYGFGYSNSTNQRLTLNSFEEKDMTGNPVKFYGFTYNNVSILPMYDGNYTDHWGFYNGIYSGGQSNDVDGQQVSQVYNFKQTNSTTVTSGLLNRIDYPTGGFTLFTWEAHDYSQAVALSRQSLYNLSGYAGGSRISEIKTYNYTGEVSLDKKYYYKKNYSSGIDPSTLSSSGVLNGVPQYWYSLNNRSTTNNYAVISYYSESLNSQFMYSYAGERSYIGYDEVVEVNADGSYIKHLFTNYGTDINGISHFDKLPAGYIGWDPIQDIYFPCSSLELERGKPIQDLTYNSQNTLVQKRTITYRSDASRFDNYLKLIDYRGSYACSIVDGLILAASLREYTYNYYPANIQNISYDLQGKNPVTSNISYTYNSNNDISSKVETNSKGETILTTYKYPADYPGDATLQAMTNAHILSPVVETAETNNGGQVSMTHVNYYSPYQMIYVPQNVQVKVGGSTIETRQQFYQYDSKGSPVELSKSNDVHEVYLWGYNSQYPVAKIIGATYSQVQQIMAQNGITQSQLDNAASITDADLRTLLNIIRTNLSGAFVNTFTYRPVTGITSETDARGKTIYYEYDNFQRLRLIKDQDGNIIKTFSYQYKLQ